MALRNKYLGKSSYDINEEKIDLKKDVIGESKAAKILQNLEYEKNDVVVAIADKIRNIKKTNQLF